MSTVYVLQWRREGKRREEERELEGSNQSVGFQAEAGEVHWDWARPGCVDPARLFMHVCVFAVFALFSLLLYDAILLILLDTPLTCTFVTVADDNTAAVYTLQAMKRVLCEQSY